VVIEQELGEKRCCGNNRNGKNCSGRAVVGMEQEGEMSCCGNKTGRGKELKGKWNRKGK
jgi:hypothetical protein